MQEEDPVVLKIRKMIPIDHERCLVMSHLIGACSVLAQHISDTSTLESIPQTVRYAMVSAFSNVMAIISDCEEINIPDLLFREILSSSSEQQQEQIYRKTKDNIFKLYNFLKKEESI